MGAFWRAGHAATPSCAGSGPEKGVIHLATAAIVNAVWDLYAKSEGKPLWKLLADMSPARARRVHRLPLHHRRADARRGARAAWRRTRPPAPRARPSCSSDGYPAYTTSAGWLGYDDEQVRRLVREALADGWTHFKLKVGADPADDLRRAALLRDEIGRGLEADDRREPGLGRRRGDRVDGPARPLRPVVDRGADEPRRRARPRRDRARRSRRSASPPASTSTTG